jgi:hypothetical protein
MTNDDNFMPNSSYVNVVINIDKAYGVIRKLAMGKQKQM